MINIKAIIPEGNAKRLYTMIVNGFKFSFEVENTEQAGKPPLEILYDELRVIVGLVEKHLGINQSTNPLDYPPATKELPEGEKKITLEDLRKGDA